MMATEYKYITVDEAGVARIGKTRYKVKHLAADVRYHGWSPYELLWQHPDLTLGQIYSALAYYADHQAEMDAAMDEEAEMVRQARKSQPSDVREQLVARLKKA
ncbi:MAG TPA: DUF433 domain-containing protein [Candidatus Xenobia bacterium]|jgi:uncharacterized protein (DUF433 family)